jgi:hypothetical protein
MHDQKRGGNHFRDSRREGAPSGQNFLQGGGRGRVYVWLHLTIIGWGCGGWLRSAAAAGNPGGGRRAVGTRCAGGARMVIRWRHWRSWPDAEAERR